MGPENKAVSTINGALVTSGGGIRDCTIKPFEENGLLTVTVQETLHTIFFWGGGADMKLYGSLNQAETRRLVQDFFRETHAQRPWGESGLCLEQAAGSNPSQRQHL